ncbi:hypothetical protein niasHS_017386 [Heterodera schachtii]|uniref:Uncharacterized protein n=1 Tax=Heterodera schachtii TaxID=97005 RepID=A0ABD2HVM9_HETSC
MRSGEQQRKTYEASPIVRAYHKITLQEALQLAQSGSKISKSVPFFKAGYRLHNRIIDLGVFIEAPAANASVGIGTKIKRIVTAGLLFTSLATGGAGAIQRSNVQSVPFFKAGYRLHNRIIDLGVFIEAPAA